MLPESLIELARRMEESYRTSGQWWVGAERPLTIEGAQFGAEPPEPATAAPVASVPGQAAAPEEADPDPVTLLAPVEA
jgi:hypothetical protein